MSPALRAVFLGGTAGPHIPPLWGPAASGWPGGALAGRRREAEPGEPGRGAGTVPAPPARAWLLPRPGRGLRQDRWRGPDRAAAPGAEGRLVPGHHEGDPVMGSATSNSAAATIVERMTSYLTLVPLPHGHTADAVAGAVIERMKDMPAWLPAP